MKNKQKKQKEKVDDKIQSNESRNVKTNSNMGIVLKTTIIALTVIVIILVVCVMYYIGKNNATEEEKDNITNNEVLNKNNEDLLKDKEGSISGGDMNSKTLLTGINNIEGNNQSNESADNNQNKDLSKDDLKKIKQELDGVANGYDDFQGIDNSLRSWLP